MATSFLRQHNVDFTEHQYDCVERRGTAESARQLSVDEHAVTKTLVMQDRNAKPLIVLMHGDCQARSPFGPRKALPIYVERTGLALSCDLHQWRESRLPGPNPARRC